MSSVCVSKETRKINILKMVKRIRKFLLQSRTDLEQHSVEGSSTSDSVSFITFVQSLKRKLKNWEKVMEVSKTIATLSVTLFVDFRTSSIPLLGLQKWSTHS